MGTKDYLPGQIYSLTDYTQQQPVQDTAMLRGRRPWYSEEYQDDILYTHTEPWLATQTGMFSAAERIGEKQYELTNHLGNVMATVSDNKYGAYTGKGNVTFAEWHPAIRAAYDYYPFGMLMPDRYVSDTSRHCVTITRPHWVWKWTVIGCKDYYEWIWPKLTLMGAATAAPTDNGILLNAQHPGDGMSFELNALPNTENQLQLELNGLDMSKNAALQILEQNGEEGWTVLTEVPIKDGEGLTVPFYPSLGKVKVVLLGPIRVFIRRVCAEGMAWVEEDQLVTICDGDGDRYRYGFNGMYKDNEMKGIGNSLDFGARMYDSRTGRWLSLDPYKHLYTAVSPYAFALNTPIREIDPDGNVVIYVNGEVLSFGGKFNKNSKTNPQRASVNYWGENFVSRVNRAFGESPNNRRFVDGDLSISASTRYSRAYTQAVNDYKDIEKSLARDENGKIIETIKLVSHSKGSSAANGYIEGLKSMIDQNKEKYANPNNVITSHIMLAPHQSWAMKIKHSNTATVGITHAGDPLSDDDVRGDVVNIFTKGLGWKSLATYYGGGHSQSTFGDETVQVAEQLQQNQTNGEDKYNGLDGLLEGQTDYNPPDAPGAKTLPIK